MGTQLANASCRGRRKKFDRPILRQVSIRSQKYAYVYWKRKRLYFGQWNSRAAKLAYQKWILTVWMRWRDENIDEAKIID